jgi:hypothetical protein
MTAHNLQFSVTLIDISPETGKTRHPLEKNLSIPGLLSKPVTADLETIISGEKPSAFNRRWKEVRRLLADSSPEPEDVAGNA